MVHVDLGSRGPWSEPEEFSLDFETAAFILGNYGPTVDGFASRRNKLCHQYFSLALEEEALGRNFFEQELKQEEVLSPSSYAWKADSCTEAFFETWSTNNSGFPSLGKTPSLSSGG